MAWRQQERRVWLDRKMLYVGQLSLMTTERDLFQLFNSVAKVVGVYLPRDVSKFSRGFAFIKFERTEGAVRAMGMLSNHYLHGKPIRVKYAFLDPGGLFFEIGRIFVKNLDKSVDLETLRDVFSAFGRILFCAILRDRGHATLCYDTMEASLEAIKQMNCKVLKGKEIFVDPFICEEEGDIASGIRQKAEWSYLYVDNIDKRISDDHLLRLFAQFGVLTSYELRTSYGRFGREPCWISFSTLEEASTACSAMHEKLVGDKPLSVVKAKRGPPLHERQPAGLVPLHRGDPRPALPARQPRPLEQRPTGVVPSVPGDPGQAPPPHGVRPLAPEARRDPEQVSQVGVSSLVLFSLK